MAAKTAAKQTAEIQRKVSPFPVPAKQEDKPGGRYIDVQDPDKIVEDLTYAMALLDVLGDSLALAVDDEDHAAPSSKAYLMDVALELLEDVREQIKAGICSG